MILLMLVASAATGSSIEWRDWTPATFADASAATKLIFVDVGIEGCTACRRMDEITFTDPGVIERLNRHFVAISVDAEARPDLGERYSDWAWPALIFMTSDTTQVLAIRGNRRPDNFVVILDKLINDQQAGTLTADALAPYAAPPAPVATDLTTIRNRVRAQLDRAYSDATGGWSRRGVSLNAGPRLRHVLMRADMYDNNQLRAMGMTTSDAFLGAIDPVWGGVYNGVFGEGRYVPEKRITPQANAMFAFADAYQLTGDPAYLEAMAAVHRFVGDFFTSEDGLFFTSQEDRPVGYRGETTAYWALDTDAGRRVHGIPPIDHAAYTDKNAQMIVAYLRAFDATSEASYLEAALTAANTITRTRATDEGWVVQTRPSDVVAADHRMRPHAVTERPFLSAQAWFGTAQLALYQSTADARWLTRAKRLAASTQTHLEDRSLGGFFSTSREGASAVVAPRKPLELNARAAHFFYDLGILTKSEAYLAVAERTIRAVAAPGIIRREGKVTGETAVALEKLTAAYVEFSVVGEPEDARSRALYAAGRATYQPRKLLHYEAPGRYPQRKRPAMYICNPDTCSVPIEDPDDVARQAALLRAPATSG
jgi:uncharacterized protein YyaL (SSP411 family)